jgi:hypothetical protein
MATQPHDAGSATAAVLDRLVAEFVADVRAWGGPHVDDQRDPGGRIVSYSYHWHEPNEQGVCENWIVYGYPTPLAALSAGFRAKVHSDGSADEDRRHADQLMVRCGNRT